jgi:predicted metal-dependent RNase
MESAVDDQYINVVFATVTDIASSLILAAHNCQHILHDLSCFGHISQLTVNKASHSEVKTNDEAIGII